MGGLARLGHILLFEGSDVFCVEELKFVLFVFLFEKKTAKQLQLFFCVGDKFVVLLEGNLGGCFRGGVLWLLR